MKRFMAILLTAALSAGILAGCGTNTTSSSTAATGETTKAAAGATTTAADTTAAAKLEPVKLTWYFPGNFPQVDQDLVFAEVNKILKEKINCTVDFKPCTFGEYDQKMQVVIASGEDYDICFTSSWTNNYSQNVAKGAFLPLDDLLVKYAPQTLANVSQDMWSAAKVQGKIYAVINQQISARTPSVQFPKALVEKYNFDLNSINGKLGPNTLSLLEPYLEAVKKDDPTKGFIGQISQLGGEFFGYELIGGWQNPGAVAFSDASMKVVNFYETPEFKAYAQTMRDWNAKGYQNSKVRISQKTDEWSDAKAGKWSVYIGSTFQPGGDVGASAQGGEPYACIASGTPYLTTGGITATMQAINRNSKNPERAMMLLELLNTDKELFNLLNSGIKDKHYTIDSDGFLVKEGDAALAYYPNVNWMFASNYLAYPPKGGPIDVWEQQKAINNSSTPSNLLGFSFDAEPVKDEIGKCAAVVDEYYRGIELGVADEAKYNEFIGKLKTAGADKIVAEMQKQIDAWKVTL